MSNRSLKEAQRDAEKEVRGETGGWSGVVVSSDHTRGFYGRAFADRLALMKVQPITTTARSFHPRIQGRHGDGKTEKKRKRAAFASELGNDMGAPDLLKASHKKTVARKVRVTVCTGNHVDAPDDSKIRIGMPKEVECEKRASVKKRKRFPLRIK